MLTNVILIMEAVALIGSVSTLLARVPAPVISVIVGMKKPVTAKCNFNEFVQLCNCFNLVNDDYHQLRLIYC